MIRGQLDAIRDEVIRLYKSGLSSTAVAVQLGCRPGSVGKLLRRNAVARRSKGSYQSSGLEGREDEVVMLYKGGLPIGAIKRQFHTTSEKIAQLLKDRGVTRRPVCDHKRIYRFNESYFSEINTEAKAYWLGFLAADGNVTSAPQYQIRLRLACVDFDHVELFRQAIDYPVPATIAPPARTGKGCTDVAGVCVSSCKMATDLIRHGVIPNKTLTLQPWVAASDELQTAYWRGYFDGDGCIHSRDCNGFPWYEISIAGTQAVCEAFDSFIRCRLPTRFQKAKKSVRKRGRIHVAKYGGRGNIIDAVTVLYKNATVSLERKRLLADRIMADVCDRPRWVEITAEQIIEAYARLGNWSAVARHFGMGSPGTPKAMITRLTAAK